MVEPVSTAAVLGSAGIGAATSLTGSLLSGKSARKAAKQANALSIWQQLQNQKWQEYMSNTAHQREVKDLKAAGLNPVLSANSGASVGSGGIGNAPQSASTDYTSAAKGAAEGFEKALALKNIKNQTEATKADIGLKDATKDKTNVEEGLTEIQKANAEIENEILTKTKNDIINATNSAKKAEQKEAEVRIGNAYIDKENQSSALWRFAKGFGDVAGLLTGPLGAMIQMAASAKKAGTLDNYLRKPIRERFYGHNGKYGLKETEYE